MASILAHGYSPMPVISSDPNGATIFFSIQTKNVTNATLTFDAWRDVLMRETMRGSGEFTATINLPYEHLSEGEYNLPYEITATGDGGGDTFSKPSLEPERELIREPIRGDEGTQTYAFGLVNIVVEPPEGGGLDATRPTIKSLTSNLVKNIVVLNASTSSVPVNVTFTLEATDDVGVSNVSMNNGAVLSSQTPPYYQFTKAFSFANYNYGTTNQTFTATVSDAAGNTGNRSITITVIKNDDVDPVISSFSVSPTSITFSGGTGTANVTFTAIASDNRAITSHTLTEGGTNYTLINQENNTYTSTVTLYASNFPTGTTSQSYIFVFEDAAGNVSSVHQPLDVTVASYDTIDTTNSNTITLTANLNNSLIYNGPYIGIKSRTITQAEAATYNVKYNMPTGSISLPLGDITATLPDGSNGGVYNTFLDITADILGRTIGSVRIYGGNITATVAEDTTKAQHVAWDNETTPSVTSTSPDVLSSTLTKAEVEAQFQTTLDSISAAYTRSVLTGWTFQISAVSAVNGSIFSSFVAANGRDPPAVFLDGEYVVLDTTHPYSVSIVDLNGISHDIVPSTPIYARIIHDSSAPSL